MPIPSSGLRLAGRSAEVRWSSRSLARSSRDLVNSPFAGKRLHNVRHHGLGVAEYHERIVGGVEFVIDTRKTGLHGALDGDTRPGLVGIDDRHAVDGAALVMSRGRIDHIVGPNDHR